MAITVTTESVQHNFYQLVRQLINGEQDKVIATDNGVNLFQMVTYAVYAAADPLVAADAEEDIIAVYSGSPAVYNAPLYRLIKRMRDRLAAPAPQAAVGRINVPAGGGADTSDTETITLTATDGTVTVYEFDSDASITGDVAITFVGTENQAAMAALIAAAITAGVTGVADATGVTLTQDDPGTAGNSTIAQATANYTVSGFVGGMGNGVLALKKSKNDSTYVIAIVPQDHAVAIGL